MKYYNLLFATCSVLALTGNGYAVATPLDTSHIQHILGLKPISSLADSFNLAAATFLPDAEDGFGFGSNNFNDNISSRDNCSGFALSSCPAHAKCSKCTFGNKYKITGCETDYKQSGNACVAKTCSEINAGYKDSVPTNQICTIIGNCYSSCKNIDFSGYPLDSCPAGAVCTPHPDCGTTVAAKGNCSPLKQKVTGCTSSAQKPNSAATACIDKDDTCPSTYYKSCDTGTQGNPKYTEKGTACYQCKPDDGCNPIFKYTTFDCQQLYGKDYVATGDHGFCLGKFEECRKVAKLLYGDGSIASVADWPQNKEKTPIGIIFDETNHLAISISNLTKNNSLEDKKVKWSTSLPTNFQSNICTTVSGRINTAKLLTTAEGAPFEAAETAAAYEPAGCSTAFCRRGKWFLPSWEEWEKVQKEKAPLLEAVQELYDYLDSATWNKAKEDIDGYIDDKGHRLERLVWLSQDDIYHSNGEWNYRARTASFFTDHNLYQPQIMTTAYSIRPILYY